LAANNNHSDAVEALIASSADVNATIIDVDEMDQKRGYVLGEQFRMIRDGRLTVGIDISQVGAGGHEGLDGVSMTALTASRWPWICVAILSRTV